MIVKPVGEGGHNWVGEDSIVHDNIGLNKAIRWVVAQHEQPPLLDRVAAVSATGLDYISVGALTKNVRAVDLSMRFR